MPDETGRFTPPNHYGPELAGSDAVKAKVLHHERIARAHQTDAACHHQQRPAPPLRPRQGFRLPGEFTADWADLPPDGEGDE